MEKKIDILLAPIVLFAYKRPQHVLKTLQALKKNKYADKSLLIVYIDGPKPNDSIDSIKKIKEVIAIVESELWCKEVKIIIREINYGLSKSITIGVTEVIEEYGKIIVLEDDIVTDTFFLQFMNDALEKYENEESVACISGYIYPSKKSLPETFFIKGADCWGWATWKRAWDLNNVKAENLLNQLTIERKTYDFNFFDTYPYVQMLKDRIEGKNDSWAIIWYAHSFLKNKLCLYPGVSLVNNIGNDGSGTHTKSTGVWANQLFNKKIELKNILINENKVAKKIIAEYFKAIQPSKNSFLKEIKNKLKSYYNSYK